MDLIVNNFEHINYVESLFIFSNITIKRRIIEPVKNDRIVATNDSDRIAGTPKRDRVMGVK